MKALLVLFAIVATSAIAAPIWVTTQENNTSTFTSVGIGEDISKAKQDAMRQLANSVSSTVTSQVKQSIETKNGALSSSSKSYAEFISNSILLPEIQWKKSAHDDGIYYVMGVVSKTDLITKYRTHLDTQLKKFQYLVDKKEFDLQDFLTVQNSQELKTLAIQSGMFSNQSETIHSYYQRIQSLYDQQNRFKNSLCMVVKGKGTHGYERKIALPSVEEAISRSGISVKNDRNCQEVFLTTSSKSGNKDGKRAVIVTLKIELESPAIANKTFTVLGTASRSKKEATLDAMSKFESYFTYKNRFLSVVTSSNSKPIYIN